MTTNWSPKRSLTEVDALLTAPGTLHELETILLDGRIQRVYKNLWPSLRLFWLAAVERYSNDTYIVYESQRLSYTQVHHRAVRLAGLFRDVYNITQGDRVAICSRNCPDYLVIFWACHLIGAVSVLANAWLPPQPLAHCFTHTECKLVILDPERADVMQPFMTASIASNSPCRFLMIDIDRHSKPRTPSISSLDAALAQYSSNLSVLDHPPQVSPEDNATIIFTSGTTGLPKGVLSTQRQFLTNVLNVLVGAFRAALRRGEDCPSVIRAEVQKATLVAVPLFHVTGSTSFSMMATFTGMKIVLMRKWDVEQAIRWIKQENVTVAGGVPSMVMDLMHSPLKGHNLEGLLFGGAPAPDTLITRAHQAFPTATMIQGYGLTETNSIAVSFAGEDHVARPASTGRTSPVNDMIVTRDGKVVPPGFVGEVWLRGPNVMKGYWRDPVATDAVLTKDGWLRTGDIGYLDEEGFLFIKDRVKDIIIRGGENIDSVTVENALYADSRVLEAAAVGVPDERLGELVAAVVSIRPDCHPTTEASLIAECRTRLPRFATPVMIVILNRPFEKTPSGKIRKDELRVIARQQWEIRRSGGNGKSGREPLANFSNSDILSSYIDDLHQHQVHTQNHLKGRISEELPLPPSFFPPSSYWTSAEKDLFFHGLTIYSRLRPELIAEHIRTKSTYDVCLYLDALQVAVERENFFTDAKPLRLHLEPAWDMSTRWVEYEERLAAETISRDVCVANVESRGGAQESCGCPPSNQWETKMTGVETKGCIAVLNHIDSTGLQVLDGILKDVDHEMAATASESAYTSSHHGAENPEASDAEQDNRSDSTGRGADNRDAETDPKARRRLLKRLYMRRKRAEKLGRELNLQPEKLRPGRAQKSSKKRRPNANNTKSKATDGPAGVSEAADDADIHPVDNSGIDRIALDSTEKKELGSHSKRYSTKRHRIQEALSQSGIDSATLSSAELDLFSLSALPRVINNEDGSAFAGTISLSALRMLSSLLKQFVSDVVRSLVTTKEQENILKGKLKVWKNHEEEISVANVVECLQVLGFHMITDESATISVPRSESVTDVQAAHDPPENMQSITSSTMTIYRPLHLDGEDEYSQSESESESEELVEDDEQDVEDEKVSLSIEKGLWTSIC
ncbi:hypothetical protein CVT24_003949 [Panaeolus cyanescens]|uniref:Uncharacterized protein n=1 Tax=Panaeolus cyanescens TaxID=181874 RepID=A0A409Y6F4_9AGAR|nr:hypothetical protein CVT24_003949 [Panaeolus cyanescens]